jgi:hypothetical protein
MLAVALLLAATAGSTSAQQTVSGRVVDAESGTPVPTAIVVLLAMDSVAVTQTITDMGGAFLLEVPEPGSYLIQVSRIGVGDFRSTAFAVADGEAVQFEITVPTAPVELTGLVVEVQGDRGSDRFRQRMEEGRGLFLTPADLALREPVELVDLFRDLDGVRVTWRTVRVESGAFVPIPTVQAGANDCMAYMLDEMPIRILPGENRSPLQLFPLSTLRADDIVAVEIYRTMSEAPEELRNRAFRGIWGRGGSYQEFSCGITVFRTKPRW